MENGPNLDKIKSVKKFQMPWRPIVFLSLSLIMYCFMFSSWVYNKKYHGKIPPPNGWLLLYDMHYCCFEAKLPNLNLKKLAQTASRFSPVRNWSSHYPSRWILRCKTNRAYLWKEVRYGTRIILLRFLSRLNISVNSPKDLRMLSLLPWI